MNKLLKNNKLIAISLSTMILCFWAIFNTFPLYFNSDTAMYLDAAYQGEIGEDRPIIYGLFMRFIGFQYYLWPVVIVQSLVLSYLIYLFFNNYTEQKNHLPYFLAFVTMITFFMGGSFLSSWLMPDIFAPISILCIGFLLFVNTSSKRHNIFISILLVISIGMHNSHFFNCFGLIILVLLGFTIKSFRNFMVSGGMRLKRVFYTLILIIFSNLFWSTVNYTYNGNFKMSQSGVIFLMGNMVDMGIVDTYLAENCDKKQYKICQYKDTLPNNFLWAGNSPLYKCGGWKSCKTEYTAIVKDILTTPKYLIPVIYKSILLTFKQFFLFDTGEAYEPTQKIDQTFFKYYPDLYDHFIESKQCRGKLNFKFVNFMQTLIVGFFLLIYTLVFIYKKLGIKYRLLMAYILLALIINAWVCGTFSGVFPRYQARLVWLLPLPLFLYFMEYSLPVRVLQTVKKIIVTHFYTK